MKESKLKKVIEVLTLAISEKKPLAQILEEKGYSTRFIADYIYAMKKKRISVPLHVQGNLLELYEKVLKQEVSTSSDYKEKAKSVLKRNKLVSFEDFANFMDLSPAKSKTLLKELQEEGYSLVEEKGQVKVSAPQVSSHVLEAVDRFGALGDTHLGSKYERLDLLNRTYDRFQELGITKVFHTGNWIDGEARFNFSDIHTHGLDNQINYFLEHYPQRKGITTYYIGGDDHEGWYQQKLNLDISRYLQQKALQNGRTDLVNLGYMEADVKLGSITVRLLHPGGGSAYSISYTSQKIIESYAEDEKPDILLHGHYHKFEYLFLRGVHVFQTGCFQDQSPFMRKKRISAHLGAWCIEPIVDQSGKIIEMIQRPMTYYGSNQSWRYKH